MARLASWAYAASAVALGGRRGTEAVHTGKLLLLLDAGTARELKVGASSGNIKILDIRSYENMLN